MGGAGIAARTRRWLCGGSLIACLAVAAPAEAAPTLAKLGDFAEPTFATGAPGDGARVFVTERRGRIMVLRDGVARTFLDLTSITLSDQSERGLLSMAFAPDYAVSGRFFVYLTAAGGEIQIREYRRASADAADPASGRLLLAIPHREAGNHNGGQVQFGPDGHLWLATGDGGGGNDEYRHAQNPASLLGKLIRLDPNAPSPVVVGAGLRNPWRFSFDRVSGQIVIADVGQGAREEVNVGLAGNYGWPCFEGTVAGPRQDAGCTTGAAAPVLDRGRTGTVCSITGGYVVRDPGLPTLHGRYLYGDFCAPALRSVDLGDPGSDAPVGLSVESLSSFGEDACGRILVVSLAGPVHRLVDGTPTPCGPGEPPAVVAPDRRACSVAMRVTGVRSVRRLKRLSVAVRLDEACRATVRARIRGVAMFRSATRSLPAGRSVVRVRLTSRGLRAVRAALRRRDSLRVAVRVEVVDAAGNRRSLARDVRIRG